MATQNMQAMQLMDYDQGVQQQQITRQQAIADLLRKQSMESTGGTETIGGWAVKKSPWEGLSKIAQAFAANYASGKADEAQSDLNKASGQKLADTLSAYQSDMQGRPAQSYPVTDDEFGAQTATAPATAPNKQAALARLLQSGSPALQQLGLQQMLAKPESPFGKINPADFTPNSLRAFGTTGSVADLVPAPNMAAVSTGGGTQFYNPRTVVEGSVIPNTGNPYKDLLVPGADGNPTANIPLVDAQKAIRAAGKAETKIAVTNNSTQESEQSKVYGKGLGEIRTSIMNSGFQAPTKLARLDRMQDLLSGIDGGKLAPTIAELSSVAESFGIKLDPSLGNKQAAEALTIQMALDMRPPGTGPMTDKDLAAFMQTVPSLARTPDGRSQINKTMRASVQRDVQAAKLARDYAKRNNGVIDDNYFDELSNFYAQNPVVTPTAPAGGRPSPGAVQGGFRFKGGNPADANSWEKM